MKNTLKQIRRFIGIVTKKIIPSYISKRLDAEGYSITQFMEYVSKKVKKTDRLLDAGAGSCPYKKKYLIHTQYESTDFEDIFDKKSKNIHTFICSLDNIPKKDKSYDIVVSTQVLEHVEDPLRVLKELHRILKPKGKLFVTAPQGWGIHGAPYHFFNFTKFGLQSLFHKANFEIKFIKPRGGMFWYLGNRIQKLPNYILFQYFLETKDKQTKIKIQPLFFLIFPFYLLSLPFCKFIIPLLFFYLDKLDKKQDFTLGYQSYCVKK